MAQLFVLLIGLAVVVPFVSHEVGGFGHAWQAYQSTIAQRSGPVNWWTWGDTALLLVFGGIPWHVYFQRVLASRDEATARQLSIWRDCSAPVAAVPPALIGILACGADWSARGLASPDATLVLPYVLRT